MKTYLILGLFVLVFGNLMLWSAVPCLMLTIAYIAFGFVVGCLLNE